MSVPCISQGNGRCLIQLKTRVNESSLVQLAGYLSEVMSDYNPMGVAIVGLTREIITCGARRGLLEVLFKNALTPSVDSR